MLLVRVNVRHAHMGIVGCHRREDEECQPELDPAEDGSLVMLMMMAIMVEILYQSSWFPVDVEGEFVLLVPR